MRTRTRVEIDSVILFVVALCVVFVFLGVSRTVCMPQRALGRV